MKRRIAVILSVIFLFGTAACSSESSETGAKIDQPVSTGPANAEKTTKTAEKTTNTDDEAASVNGYMVESMMSPDVAAGKKANDSVSFSNTGLEAAGITNIADIEFFFHIFTTDGWEEFLDTDLVQVKTSLADNFEYTYDDSGKELYNEKDIRIVAKGISDDDSWFGPGLILFIENSRDKAFTVQARDVSVNGYMIDASLSEDVYPGKRSITALTFFSSDLEKNDIETFEEVELSFHIFDTDEWETIVDTEKYTLTFD